MDYSGWEQLVHRDQKALQSGCTILLIVIWLIVNINSLILSSPSKYSTGVIAQRMRRVALSVRLALIAPKSKKKKIAKTKNTWSNGWRDHLWCAVWSMRNKW